MKIGICIAAAIVAGGLSACGSIPQGPALSYEQLLPNTVENPIWARNVRQAELERQQLQLQQQQQQVPAPAPAK